MVLRRPRTERCFVSGDWTFVWAARPMARRPRDCFPPGDDGFLLLARRVDSECAAGTLERRRVAFFGALRPAAAADPDEEFLLGRALFTARLLGLDNLAELRTLLDFFDRLLEEERTLALLLGVARVRLARFRVLELEPDPPCLGRGFGRLLKLLSRGEGDELR